MNTPGFPPRPINGGPPGKDYPSGYWVEWKYNGWRCLVDRVSGALWTRENTLMSNPSEYADAIAELLATIGLTVGQLMFRFFDCEAMGRRTKFGKGTLVVLDADLPFPYEHRREWLAGVIPDGRHTSLIDSTPAQDRTISAHVDAMDTLNHLMGETIFEGVVVKHGQHRYVMHQSPNREDPGWIKHRFTQ